MLRAESDSPKIAYCNLLSREKLTKNNNKICSSKAKVFKEPWERDTCVVISIIVGSERSETTISVTSQRKRRECEFRCQPRDCATECPLPLALQYYLSCRHKGLQTYRMFWPRSNYKFCEIALLCRKQKSYSSEAFILPCFLSFLFVVSRYNANY